jgi:hypothetical protein
MTTVWLDTLPVPTIEPPRITFEDVEEAAAATRLPVELFVRIGGVAIDATEAHTRHGVDQPIGTCTIYCAAPRPSSAAMNAEIEIEMGYTGAVRRTFHGFIPNDESVSDDRGNMVRIEGVGWCSRLAYPELTGVEIAGPVSLKNAFRSLCEMREIPTYLSDDTTYVDGATEIMLGGNLSIDGGHVRFDNRTDPLTWVTRNAELYGYRVFDSPDGAVRLARVSGIPQFPYTDLGLPTSLGDGDYIINQTINEIYTAPDNTFPSETIVAELSGGAGDIGLVTGATVYDTGRTWAPVIFFGHGEGWMSVKTDSGGWTVGLIALNAGLVTYEEGVNVFRLQLSRDTRDMATYIEVQGARYTDAFGGTVEIRSIPDEVPYAAELDPPGYRQMTIRAQDIVTDEQAAGVRNVFEVDKSEVQEYVTWECIGRPDMQPGDVVQLTGETHDLDRQPLWLMSIDQSVTDQGYIARMEGWYGAGVPLAAGNDCTTQAITIPSDGTAHVGDETLSHYKDPTPDGTEVTIAITVEHDDYSSLRLSGRVHGSNSYGSSTAMEGSVIEVWQLDDPSLPESGSNEKNRKGSLTLPTANEEYNRRRNYGSSNTYWQSFNLPMPGSLKVGDAELRLIAGENPSGGVDDYEIKDLVLTTCGVGIPDLPGEA